MIAKASGALCRVGVLILLSLGLGACSEVSSSVDTQIAAGSGVELSEPSHRFLHIEEVGGGAGNGEYTNIVPARVEFHPQALAAVGTPVAARVVSVHVRPGQAVEAGAPLVTLQSPEAAVARATLAQAQAKAAAAEDLLQRQSAMVERGVGLEVERFAAESAAKEARAELERAQHMVALLGKGKGDRFSLRAPASGVVLSVRAYVGGVVSPEGDALVEIGDPKRLLVVAYVPESKITALAFDQEAKLRVPAVDAETTAVVDGVGHVVDSEQRRLPVYLSLKEPIQGLSAGMLAEARLPRASGGKLSLPTTAVLIKSGGNRVVYVQREDGRFEPRPVRTGRSQDGHVTILEGVERGDKVVIRGALLLDGEAEQLL